MISGDGAVVRRAEQVNQVGRAQALGTVTHWQGVVKLDWRHVSNRTGPEVGTEFRLGVGWAAESGAEHFQNKSRATRPQQGRVQSIRGPWR
jgi:hypothetical protein